MSYFIHVVQVRVLELIVQKPECWDKQTTGQRREWGDGQQSLPRNEHKRHHGGGDTNENKLWSSGRQQCKSEVAKCESQAANSVTCLEGLFNHDEDGLFDQDQRFHTLDDGIANHDGVEEANQSQRFDGLADEIVN